MGLDEEPEDTQRYQPSGFLNPLTLPEVKGYPSSRFPNLYGMVTHIGIRNHPGFTPGNYQSMCTTRSPDQHRPATTTVRYRYVKTGWVGGRYDETGGVGGDLC